MRSVPKVLVLSQGRSGSSFLGSLLSADHNAFYFYEPFKGMAPDGKNFVDKSDAAKSFVVENIINNLFNCTLTLEERTKLQTRKVRRINTIYKPPGLHDDKIITWLIHRSDLPYDITWWPLQGAFRTLCHEPVPQAIKVALSKVASL